MAEASGSAVTKFEYKDFTDKKSIGDGSFNQVYEAQHPKLGKCVIKIVSRSLNAKPKQKRKLEEEAVSMFSIKHEHLIRGYGIVMEPEHLCLVFEFAEYGSLADALHRIQIPWPLKIRIAYQVGLAVRYLHSREEYLVHRNLKSSNVLLKKDFTAKVSDFILPKHQTWITLATQQKDITDRRKLANKEKVAHSGTILAHIPPETVHNINAKPTPSYDSYSFSVILWEMLTNKQPFKDETTEEVFELLSNRYILPYDEILPNYPQVLFDIMDATFHHQPEDRPSFIEICETLKPFHDQNIEIAKSSAIECQQHYERYKVMRREESQRQSRKDPSANDRDEGQQSTSAEAARQARTFVEPVTAPTKPTPAARPNPAQGQIVNTSAHVAFAIPASRDPPKQTHPSMRTTVHSLQSPMDEDEEVIPVPPTPPAEPGLSKTQKSSSVSSSKEEVHGSAFGGGKSPETTAVPIRYPDPLEDEMEVETGRSRTVYNIRATNLSLQVGDGNQITSVSESPLSPPTMPIDASMIRARGSTRTLNIQDIAIVSDRVGSKWKMMARWMDLSDGQIDVINHDYDRDGLSEKIYQTVRHWTRKFGGQVTVGQIVEVLISANMLDAAYYLYP